MNDMSAYGMDRMDRRHFLGVVAAGTMAGGVAACSDATEGLEASDEAREPATPGEYHESSMLAERVEAGDLPPLAERLPNEPYVVRPDLLIAAPGLKTQPGKFGGRLELPQESPSWDPDIFLGNMEPLLWAPGGFDYEAGIEGNVVAGYEVNDDDTVFTFHLREGLKWSDGEPVTIEDVRFAFDDVLLDEELTPAFPAHLRPGLRADKPPAEFEVVDDLTFRLTFAEPYGTFPAQIAIAQWRSYGDLIKPRHYLEQFHQKYASADELAALLEEESLPEDEWFNLFNAKQLTAWLDVSNEQFLGHPTLTAWTMQRSNGGTFTYERNPYYFKVDTAGNQLPYIDEIRAQVVQDQETLVSRSLFGEFDFLGGGASFRNLPLMVEKQDAGEINLLVGSLHIVPETIFLNLTHPDDVWREVVRDIRFRQALNLALNREEIIENFYLGEFASVPERYGVGTHDVDEANRLLDEMGLDERDGDGFRLGPDGEQFRVPLEVADLTENHLPLGELVTEYWKDVGVFTSMRQIDGANLNERQANNDIKATIVWAQYPIWQSAGWDDYLPHNAWGPLWQQWYVTQGEEGEEPPAEIQELFDWHGRLMSARSGTPESQEAFRAIADSHRDNVWTIPVTENAYAPAFFSSRIKNVPTGMKEDVFGVIVNIGMEQWYIDDDS